MNCISVAQEFPNRLLLSWPSIRRLRGRSSQHNGSDFLGRNCLCKFVANIIYHEAEWTPISRTDQ